MPVNHTYSAASGELITSGRWNADHDITGKPSIFGPIIFEATEDGSTYTVSSTNYEDVDGYYIYIPGNLTQTFNRTLITIRFEATWAAAQLADCYFKIIDSSETYAYLANHGQPSASKDTLYTITSGQQVITSWPTTNAVYKCQLQCSQDDATFTIHQIHLYAWIA